MDDATSQLITNLLTPVMTAIAGAISLAIGAWAASKMPGPVRDALTSAVHARDMAILSNTLARRATAEIADHRTPAPTAAELVAYVERVRGDLMAKMNVNPEGLETMAAAAIATATATPVVAVDPISLVVRPDPSVFVVDPLDPRQAPG